MKTHCKLTCVVLVVGVVVLAASCGGRERKLKQEKIARIIEKNETSVIGNLKTIARGEEQFKNHLLVDSDSDGTGEYGFLQQLSGAIAVFNPTASAASTEAVLPPIFGLLDENDLLSMNGYFFRLYLPNSERISSDADFVYETKENVPELYSEAADNAERLWTCYAWPVKAGLTGARAFCISNEGVVYFTANDEDAQQVYSGTDDIPPAAAAFFINPAEGITRLVTSEYYNGALYEGRDGNVWMPVY